MTNVFGNYGIKDLLFYSGLFGGIIITFLALESFEIHRLIRLIIGVFVGAGIGYLMQMAAPKKSGGDASDDAG